MIFVQEFSHRSQYSSDASHFKYTQTDRAVSMVALVVIAGAALAVISIAALATFEAAVITAVIAIPVAIILILTANKGHHYFISRRNIRPINQSNIHVPYSSVNTNQVSTNRQPKINHIQYPGSNTGQGLTSQQFQPNQQPNRQPKSDHTQYPGSNTTQVSGSRGNQTDRQTKRGHTTFSSRESNEDSGKRGQNRGGNQKIFGNPRR